MDELRSYIEKLNIDGADEKTEQLRQYMEGVLSWNEKVNLTAITDRQAFVQKHYIDSLLCAENLAFTASSSICDVGTGGGFPGVPLAVCYPDKEFVLMDSLQKRVKIVRELCDEIGLRNVTVIHGRAEELARKKEYRENFDLCVSRAVANMQVLSEYCLPFVRKGGFFISYKTEQVQNEIDQGKNAIKVLGGGNVQVEFFTLPGTDYQRSLVKIEKVAATPPKYPRKAGTPAKEPIR